VDGGFGGKLESRDQERRPTRTEHPFDSFRIATKAFDFSAICSLEPRTSIRTKARQRWGCASTRPPIRATTGAMAHLLKQLTDAEHTYPGTQLKLTYTLVGSIPNQNSGSTVSPIRCYPIICTWCSAVGRMSWRLAAWTTDEHLGVVFSASKTPAISTAVLHATVNVGCPFCSPEKVPRRAHARGRA
jgi:hypothetical protein